MEAPSGPLTQISPHNYYFYIQFVRVYSTGRSRGPGSLDFELSFFLVAVCLATERYIKSVRTRGRQPRHRARTSTERTGQKLAAQFVYYHVREICAHACKSNNRAHCALSSLRSLKETILSWMMVQLHEMVTNVNQLIGI